MVLRFCSHKPQHSQLLQPGSFPAIWWGSKAESFIYQLLFQMVAFLLCPGHSNLLMIPHCCPSPLQFAASWEQFPLLLCLLFSCCFLCGLSFAVQKLFSQFFGRNYPINKCRLGVSVEEVNSGPFYIAILHKNSHKVYSITDPCLRPR